MSGRRKNKDKRHRSIRGLELLEVRQVLDSTVVFNEVMYHPTDPAGTLEFVELYNQMTIDMDISAWRLDDGIEFTFPAGTIVPGDGYLVIAKDPQAFRAATGVEALGPFDGRLANGGEEIELRDRNNRLMDALDYDDEGNWPLGADGAGVSLAKRRLHASSDRADNWTSSVLVGGTPGRSNFGDFIGPPPEPTVETVIGPSAVWSYWAADQAPGGAWSHPDFDDSAWSNTSALSPDTEVIFYAGDARLAGSADQLIENVTATASSALPGMEPQFAADGSGITASGHVTSPPAGTMWQSNGNFFGLVPDLDPEITFDLGQETSLQAMRVWNYNNVDSASCCLNRGMALADVLIAGDDGQFSPLIDNLELAAAPGTETNFAQEVSLAGATARYVKFDVDTTQGVANHGDVLSFVGLSEVQFLTAPVPGTVELPRSDKTTYFRHEFDWQVTAGTTQLIADLLVDDGAIVYLNGVEIHRHNLAAGPVDHDSLALFPVADAEWIRALELPSDQLRSGTNVLAVELHQATPQDRDLLFGMELTAIVTPGLPSGVELLPLAINEVSAAGGNRLQVELFNYGTEPLNLADFRLTLEGQGPVPLPANTVLAPQGFAVVRWDAVPQTVAAGDRLFLYDGAGERLFDAAVIKETSHARVPDGTGVWFASDLSLGLANPAVARDEIVINEIMYNHRPHTVGTVDDQEDYRDIPEEWIELFNRSDRAVDLSGWALAGGTEFTFPAGTVLAPAAFVVVSNDADALRQKYPDRAGVIVGNLQRGLNNQNDQIELLDARGNLADRVEYFENGQWPEGADGRGSSLELRDPRADNSVGLAWAASEESDDAPWQTYTYRGTPSRSSLGPDNAWQEFLLGLLAEGEVLLDDISVIQDPDGEAIQLIQNGDFSADTLGASPATWRIIGNHRHSAVVVDPDDPTNQVLRFVATGATEHMHNHAGTTLKDGDRVVQISNRQEYEISYRAKWITGTNLLNTRLYFNRLPLTTAIERPEFHGTPGRPNSTLVANLGPTYRDFLHQPAVPAPNQPTTVTVQASDPQQVAQMTLWYSVAGGAWNSTAMQGGEGGRYSAQIPGQQAGAIVQFYVEGTDGGGATSTFPRNGRDSRALYQVNDGLAETNGLHNLRLILTPDDAEFLHTTVELMSNDDLGATLIYNETEIFYDAGVRLSGSQRARTVTARLSFNVSFPSDHLFRGVHSSIALDRSESTGFGQRELIYHHGMSHAGGLPTEYNDLIHIITPQRVHTGPAEAQMARYSDQFLDAQYEDGSSGQLYEYELVYYPTTTEDRSPEGRKLPQPDSVVGTSIRRIGDDKEDYRWAFLNKNNRNQDDYRRLMEFAAAMGTPTSTFNDVIGDFIDVDQWLRAFAFSTITGHGDNYGADGSQHNLQLYIRPSDQRVEFFPHDLDAFFDARRPLMGNPDLTRLTRLPANDHHYLGHVHDMIQTTFNEDYMRRWTEHFGSFLPRQRFDAHLRDLVTRSNFLLEQIERRAPRVDFALTSTSPVTATPLVPLQGTGWVNVREIRLAGTLLPLDVDWTARTEWSVHVPVPEGESQVTLEAFDFQGAPLGAVNVLVTRRPGDFDADGSVGAADLELLCQHVQTSDLAGDLNGDGEANLADLRVMVQDVLGTEFGDANLDGVFDSRDLVVVFQAGEYEDAEAGNSSWAEGDWNCDGDFTSRDIVLAFQEGGYVAGALADVVMPAPVAEPLSAPAEVRAVDIVLALMGQEEKPRDRAAKPAIDAELAVAPGQ